VGIYEYVGTSCCHLHQTRPGGLPLNAIEQQVTACNPPTHRTAAHNFHETRSKASRFNRDRPLRPSDALISEPGRRVECLGEGMGRPRLFKEQGASSDQINAQAGGREAKYTVICLPCHLSAGLGPHTLATLDPCLVRCARRASHHPAEQNSSKAIKVRRLETGYPDPAPAPTRQETGAESETRGAGEMLPRQNRFS
jgi:hypothetical protein